MKIEDAERIALAAVTAAKASGGDVTDVLALWEREDSELRAATSLLVQRHRMVWQLEGIGEASANLAIDRGTESFIIGIESSRPVITGKDDSSKLFEFQDPSYARAMALLGVAEIKKAGTVYRGERSDDDADMWNRDDD